MALLLLLVVFAFVILLLVAFVFPPTKWLHLLHDKKKDEVKKP
jgi:hypothetical protein